MIRPTIRSFIGLFFKERNGKSKIFPVIFLKKPIYKCNPGKPAVPPPPMDSFEVSVDFEDERPKKVSHAKYPHAKEVFRLWDSRPLNWNINASQLQAAENLYKERGITGIKDALEWYKDMETRFKHDPFLPKVRSPFDLDSKWDKLEDFNDKHS